MQRYAPALQYQRLRMSNQLMPQMSLQARSLKISRDLPWQCRCSILAYWYNSFILDVFKLRPLQTVAKERKERNIEVKCIMW